jgi:membrane fusion protein, multidrug efflux system
MKHMMMFAVLVMANCKKPEEAVDPTKKSTVAVAPLKVATGIVEIEKVPRYLTLTGSVFADRQSDVAANVSGRVTNTYVERGMPVKAGQVLAVVDSRAAGFQVAAAQAQSQAAQTQVTQAKQECERADTLFGQGAIPKTEFERLKTQCTAQLYQANAAQANADLAGKLAGDTVIRSPIDGFVGERFVNVGEFVQPPSRVASVFAVSPARISISVPESAVSQIKEGQLLNVEVSAYPKRGFPATVRFVSPILRANTRDMIVEASAKNEDSSLRPGMFAVVRLAVGDEELPTVPVSAVKADGTVKRIFMVKNGLAYEIVASTGVEQNGRISIREPLEAGAKVILNPPPGLNDGTPVSPTVSPLPEAAKPGSGSAIQ